MTRKAIPVLVLALFLLMPLSSHAAVNAGVELQIKALLQRVEELRAQLLLLRPVAPRTVVPVAVVIQDRASKVADFLIQDVCVDGKGNVLALDPASPSCTNRRNLKYGERLPYHKHDQHGTDKNPAAADGYQRSDSFPASKDLSLIGHSFDFGVGGAAFGRKDANDGFNLYETRGTYASAIATEDAVGGVQYFISSACASGKGNEDSWGLFPTSMRSAGSEVFSLQIASLPGACPTSFSKSFTAWDFPSSPLTYTNGVKLETALSYHYSHPTVAASDHLEKFYFTREYGATRWERWERSGTPYHSQEKERAAAKASTGVCNGPSVTSDATGPWYLVDCREWTDIQPATGSDWYNPQSWNIPSILKAAPVETKPTTQTDTTTTTPAPSAGIPDLTLSNVSSISATAGVPFTMSATVHNGGTGSTGGTFSNFWRVCDLGCASLNEYGSGTTGTLAAGSSKSVSFSYTLQNPGTYYYTMCADLPASVTESNEDNNCSVGNQITVRAAVTEPGNQPATVNTASALNALEAALKGFLKQLRGN